MRLHFGMGRLIYMTVTGLAVTWATSVYAHEWGEILQAQHTAQMDEIDFSYIGTQRTLTGMVDGQAMCLQLTINGASRIFGRYGNCIQNMPTRADDVDSTLSFYAYWDGVKLSWQVGEAPEGAGECTLNADWVRQTRCTGNFNGQLIEWVQIGEVRQLFPYQIKTTFVFDDIGNRNVRSIGLYQEGVLIQRLDIPFTETWWDNQPFVEDFNFDGYLDLALPVRLDSMGTSHQFIIRPWLYNSQTFLLHDAPQDLGFLPDAVFDTKNRLIVSSRHWQYDDEISIHRWHGDTLEVVDERYGYFLPLRSQGQLYYCWNMAAYDEDSATLRVPMSLERRENERYILQGKVDLTTCESQYIYHAPIMLELNYLDGNGIKNNIVLLPQMTQAQTEEDFEWYPLVPYFDLDTQRVGWEMELEAHEARSTEAQNN